MCATLGGFNHTRRMLDSLLRDDTGWNQSYSTLGGFNRESTVIGINTKAYEIHGQFSFPI